MSTHVLFLRAPKDEDDSIAGADESRDPYEAALVSAFGPSVNAMSVPVYETAHTLAELSWILETGPGFHGYKGVVATSRRAVEAWAAAAKAVPLPEWEAEGEVGEEGEEGARDAAKWDTIPFYVVGEASASAARALRSNAGVPPRLAPGDVLGGAEANTAEELAHFIRKHVEGASSDRASAGAAQAASGATSEPQPVAGTVFDDYDTLSTLAGSTHEGAASAHASTDNLLAPATQSPTSSTFDSNTAPPPAAGTSSSSILPIQAYSPSVRSVPGRVRPRGATLQHIPTKLLFLVGDKTRDVLPRVLAEGNKAHPGAVPIEVDAVQVYATRPSAGLEGVLSRAVKAQSGVKTWWVALFAPSGADAAVPFLRQHFMLPDISGASSASSSSVPSQQKRKGSSSSSSKKAPAAPPPLPSAKIAAIGPTTAAHVRNVLKLEVAAVAAKPNPEALASVIKAAI